MNRCPYCGVPFLQSLRRYGNAHRTGLTGACSQECADLCKQLDRVAIVVPGAIVEQVHDFARAVGVGYAAAWDHLLGIALERLEQPRERAS